jgi:hypothetical protein
MVSPMWNSELRSCKVSVPGTAGPQKDFLCGSGSTRAMSPLRCKQFKIKLFKPDA